MTYQPKARPPSVKQVLDQQKADAERGRQQKATLAAVPAGSPEPALPAGMPPDTRTSVQRYLDDVAPASIVGRAIRGNKEHVFATADDGEPVPDDVDFTALCDQTMVGLIRFNGEGVPPDQKMGLLYDGFQMPDRAALGDTDPASWELGLDGKPLTLGNILSTWCCNVPTPRSYSHTQPARSPAAARLEICFAIMTACRRRIPTCIRWCI